MKAQIVYDKPCRIRFRCGSNAFTKELERSIHKLVMSYIYAFYRYTWNSIALSCTLVHQFPKLTAVELLAFTSDLMHHLRTLYAQSFRITLATYVLPRLLARS